MLITDKKELTQFASKERIWQGIPSIERTEKGRMFSVFYSGDRMETWGNYVVLLKSDDDGKTWTEPIACAYDGLFSRCFDSVLWVDPKGRLWWCWSVMPVNSVWASVCDDPDAEELTWSDPRPIGGEVMMNRPTVLSDGSWLFPMAVWRDGVREKRITPSFGPEKLSFVYRTADEGKTFQRIGGADVPERSFDEHMVLEKKDGSLLMLVRTFYGIGKSISKDGGRTWTPGEESGIPGPCSRFHICRLASGRILLVNNDDAHDRIKLSAWLSEDDGETWKGPLLLDERKEVSYPDAVERNGFIWITYDRERGDLKSCPEEAEKDAREILFAKITEEDILAGTLVNRSSSLRNIISKLSGHCEKATAELFSRKQWHM